MMRPLALALVLMAGPAGAAETMLRLTAEAEVARAPDLVTLSGGVSTTAPGAAAAMAENAAAMRRVVAAVAAAGVAARDIQTEGLSLQPQYDYSDRKATLTGYQARNMVRLRLRDVDRVGALIDAMVKAGANQISGPVFAIEKADAALDEARRAAVAKARARAALYAEAAGLKLVRIASISESGGQMPEPRPMLRMAADSVAESTPVAPGEVAMVAGVTMEFVLE
ncbi:MAG: SIMPL domain-containing protein [Polymorphobacter sp.]|uniref:SIMPL domain-containing protein n=1 Tax=Polymorphobacter sp. TaxID=1909290 RepID=UPI003A86B399